MAGKKGPELHRLEISLLSELSDGKERRVEELADESGLDEAAVVKAAFWLEEKGLAKVREETTEFLELTDEGERVAEKGLAERQILEKIKKGPTERKELGLPPAVVNFALGWLKKKGWAEIKKEKGKIVLEITKEGEKALEEKGEDEKAIEVLAEGRKPVAEVGEKIAGTLKSRQLAEGSTRTERWVQATREGLKIETEKLEEKTERLEQRHIQTGEWKELEFRSYDVKAPAPEAVMAKLHPIQMLIDRIRRIFLEMGFSEKRGPMIESSFWCFDALFQPQDHPARDLADTFFMAEPSESKLPDIKEKVKEAHEKGVRGSLGWGYEWEEKIAKQPVLRTHTTALSARTLVDAEPPLKMFCIDKAFRNETLDYKHLMELYQIEGIVFDPDVNFKHLLGYLKEFYRKLGFEKVRFRPAYFPYTEMSVEPEVWYEPKKDWLELGGAGIFRPEVVEPLTGKDYPVLAWGLGLGRLVMLIYGLDDIRTPYQNDLAWLRGVKLWQ